MSRQCWNKQVSGSFSNYGEQLRVVLKVTINKLTREDQHMIMILITILYNATEMAEYQTINSLCSTSDISLQNEIAAYMNWGDSIINKKIALKSF